MAGYKIESAWDLQCKSSNYRIWASRVTRLAPCRRVQNKNQQKTRGGREHRQSWGWKLQNTRAREREREGPQPRKNCWESVGKSSRRVRGLALKEICGLWRKPTVHGLSFEDETGHKEIHAQASEQLTRNRARERATSNRRPSDRASNRTSERGRRASNRRASERGERGTRNDEQRMKV
jgi:hypothetical protein